MIFAHCAPPPPYPSSDDFIYEQPLIKEHNMIRGLNPKDEPSILKKLWQFLCMKVRQNLIILTFSNLNISLNFLDRGQDPLLISRGWRLAHHQDFKAIYLRRQV